MKKILILGAGVYQVPLIRKAKELRYYTIVVSIQGPYPGFAYADKVYYVDTTDKDKVLQIAKDEKISAICTTGTDVCVPTIGWVCDNLNLKGITYDSAMKVSNKWLMKKALLEANIKTPYGYKVDCIDEALHYFALLKNNAVLKVVDKSGSRGILHVKNEDELKAAYRECMRITDQNYLLIEQYISGMEIGVSGIVQNGEVKSIIPHSRIMFYSEGVAISLGHIFSYPLFSQKIMKKVNLEVNNAIASLSINNTAYDVDVIICDDDICIIEIAGRCGASGIPECMSIMHDKDFFECILNNALGKDISLHVDMRKHAISYLLHSENEGMLKNIIIPSTLSNQNISFDYKNGDRIPKFINGTHRIGQIIIGANSESKRDFMLEEVKKISVEVQPIHN